VDDRRVAVVTGASPGTGGGAARQLAAAGYRVFGASRTAPARDGSAIEHVVIDARDDASARAGAAGIPIGSIGPQRARCLDRLRRSGALTALREGDTKVNITGDEPSGQRLGR
jgi:NAD(P)-dependent dehydrogenase (short-subunit alcohol dehydrogenase family)